MTATGCAPSPDPRCSLVPQPDERLFWQTLALELQHCLLSGRAMDCRSQVERQEWAPVSTETAVRQQMHGTIAPGGSTYDSPTSAPEGDFCASHDDIDWNFNVTPDAEDAWFLEPANAIADVDHPTGVFEGEWEAMYMDPSFVAMPAGAGASYTTWSRPAIDMQVGDAVALEGAGVLDCGHAPYRSEIHPPYLVVWGGARTDTSVVYVRATAMLTRPADYRALPNPPDAAEALTGHFPLPANVCPGGNGSLQITQDVEWLYDQPDVIIDQGCNLENGINVTNLEGPTYDAALASPAAHIAGTSDPTRSDAFFTVTTDTSGGDLAVTVTPVARPHQALFGAKITAAWSCP